MMKRVKMLFLFLLLLTNAVEAQQQGPDPRFKALGLMAAYGAIGGFLLGTASLAFDTPGRAPFIGASLGLYAGIMFGGFIVVSHAMKKYQMQNPGAGDDGYYPETPSSPYESPFSGGGYGDENQGQELWSRSQMMNIHLEIYKSSQDVKIDPRFPKNENRGHPLFYLPLINFEF